MLVGTRAGMDVGLTGEGFGGTTCYGSEFCLYLVWATNYYELFNYCVICFLFEKNIQVH